MKMPIRLQQLPNFLTEIFHRQSVLSTKPTGEVPTFHLCYFSCHSYFPYLYCAVHSLKRHIPHPVKILIFNDSDQPISKTQIEALRVLEPNMRIIDWPKSMGWGSQQIQNIWNAYALAAEDAQPTDYIARMDSDVFFFNDRIFRFIERSRFQLIGDGHYVGLNYTQGGCYFFSAQAVLDIVQWLRPQKMDQLLAQANIDVEDRAAYYFAQTLQQRTHLTWFMMFPDELRNAGGLTRWARFKFSCIHFVMKNKNLMIDCYVKDILPPAEHADFLAILKTQ